MQTVQFGDSWQILCSEFVQNFGEKLLTKTSITLHLSQGFQSKLETLPSVTLKVASLTNLLNNIIAAITRTMVQACEIYQCLKVYHYSKYK